MSLAQSLHHQYIGHQKENRIVVFHWQIHLGCDIECFLEPGLKMSGTCQMVPFVLMISDPLQYVCLFTVEDTSSPDAFSLSATLNAEDFTIFKKLAFSQWWQLLATTLSTRYLLISCDILKAAVLMFFVLFNKEKGILKFGACYVALHQDTFHLWPC